MKQNFSHLAESQKSAIRQKLGAHDLHLEISIFSGRGRLQHWIIKRGSKHILHYWPCSGTTRDMRAKVNIGIMSPMEMCQAAISGISTVSCAYASEIDRKRKDDSDIVRRDASVSRPNSERWMECFNEKIKFGKHKGKMWRDLPSGYLHWITENVTNQESSEIARAILEERRNEESWNVAPSVDSKSSESVRCDLQEKTQRDLAAMERKLWQDGVERFGPETEIHQKYKGLLEENPIEEAPF